LLEVNKSAKSVSTAVKLVCSAATSAASRIRISRFEKYGI
jgi:hypothetical protein